MVNEREDNCAEIKLWSKKSYLGLPSNQYDNSMDGSTL